MLYWTDAQENTVNRLTTSGEKKVLVHERLDEPRAIALSPCDGKWDIFSALTVLNMASMREISEPALPITLSFENNLFDIPLI